MGFRAMLWVAFALYAGAAGLRFWMASTVRFAGEAKPVPLTLRSLRSNLGTIMGMLMGGGLLAWILVTDGVRDVSARLSNELQPLYLAQVGGATVAQVGWLRSLMGIAMMLVALPAGWISDRRGERVAIAGGFVLSSVGLVALVQSRGLAGLAAAVLLYGAGIGLVSPAYDSLVSKAVPQRLRGLAYGLFGTSLGLISLPAPWVGARLWEQFGPRVPILITAAASAAAAVPAWFKFVLPPRREDASVSKA
jgi:MFS family permease